MKKLSLLVAGLMLTAGVFAETVTKTLNELAETNKWTISKGNDRTPYTKFALDEVISISTKDATITGSVYNVNDVYEWRLYQTEEAYVTITATDGYVLTAVTMVYNDNKTGGVLYDSDDNEVASEEEYKLDKVSEVTFIVGCNTGKTNGQVRVNSFTVTYEKAGGETIAKPTFSPVTTEFEEKIEVTITTSKSNEIHYTLDGTNPTAKSTLYNGPITLTETTTIKAIAYNVEKDLASAVVEQTYTKKEAAKPITIAEAIEKAKDTEVIVEGVMVAVAAGGAVLQDETAMIYCFKSVEGLKVGDRVRATAKIAEYGGAKQLSNGTYQVLGTEEVTYPTAEKWTAATMDAWVADANREKKYVTFDATLSINKDKGYYNLTIEGATNTVSIVKPVEDIASLDNSLVTVTGYAMYVSGSKTKYPYVVATSIKKATETAVEDVVAEKKAHKVIENGVIYIIRNGVRYNALGAIAD